MMEFDKKYQRCNECKRQRLCCDKNEQCYLCAKRNLICIKKKNKIWKKIKQLPDGQRYCNTLDKY